MKRNLLSQQRLGGMQPCRKRRTRRAAAVMALAGIGVWVLAGQITVVALAAAQSSPAPGSPTPVLMDRPKEIALALSACPANVAPKAAVYVLERSGYVKVRESQNGFTAIVQHSMPTSQEPQCMDTEGARTFLPRMLKVAALRAQGKSRDEIRLAMADALAKGVFQPPTRPGVDYMLSPENLVPDDSGAVGHFPPHVMFYAPYMTNAELGSEGQAAGGPAFVAGEGTPFALVIVPVGTHAGAGHSAAEPVSGSPK
jgi:hypothetical protein